MKRLIHVLFLMIFSFGLYAQTPAHDVITKTNGEELSGKVIEISDNEIKFSYPGETLVYTFKKADIRKITYASGRTETFNNSVSSETKAGAPTQDKAALSE